MKKLINLLTIIGLLGVSNLYAKTEWDNTQTQWSDSLKNLSSEVNVEYLSKRVERGSLRGYKTAKTDVKLFFPQISDQYGLYFGFTYFNSLESDKTVSPIDLVKVTVKGEVTAAQYNDLSATALSFFQAEASSKRLAKTGAAADITKLKWVGIGVTTAEAPGAATTSGLTEADRAFLITNGNVDPHLADNFTGADPIELKLSFGSQIDFYGGFTGFIQEDLLFDIGWVFSMYPDYNRESALGGPYNVTGAPYNAKTENSNEFFAGVSYDLEGILPSLYYSHSPTFKQHALEGAIDYEHPFSDMFFLNVGAYFGYLKADNPNEGRVTYDYVPNKADYLYYGFNLGLTYAFSENLALNLGFNWATNDGEAPTEAQNVASGLKADPQNRVIGFEGGTNRYWGYVENKSQTWVDFSLTLTY